MINLGKRQLLIALILANTCAVTLGSEPNKAKTELKFEISNEEQQWLTDGGEIGKGPIKPTHAAELFIPRSEYGPAFTPQETRTILNTSAGQLMSQQQRDFLATTKEAISMVGRYGAVVPRHDRFRLYAVRKSDAKKMAQAFIDSLADKTYTIQAQRNKLLQYQRMVIRTREGVLEEEAKAKVALADFRESIKNMHYLSTDKAEQTISELNKTLNTLNIELAGMHAKLKAIQEHIERQQKQISYEKQKGGKSGERINIQRVLLKLKEMRIDLLIELEVAEARRETADYLRKQAEDFCKQMNMKRPELQQKVSKFRRDLSYYEMEVNRLKEILAGPIQTMPPQVFQNKVTIYPVCVD